MSIRLAFLLSVFLLQPISAFAQSTSSERQQAFGALTTQLATVARRLEQSRTQTLAMGLPLANQRFRLRLAAHMAKAELSSALYLSGHEAWGERSQRADPYANSAWVQGRESATALRQLIYTVYLQAEDYVHAHTVLLDLFSSGGISEQDYQQQRTELERLSAASLTP